MSSDDVDEMGAIIIRDACGIEHGGCAPIVPGGVPDELDYHTHSWHRVGIQRLGPAVRVCIIEL